MKEKSKTNLELFKSEILYKLRNRNTLTLYGAMVEIYDRETNKEITYKNVLDWFSDVPRETLEVSKDIYDFIIAYEKSVANDSLPIENYASTAVLMDIGVIPKAYSKYKIEDLIKVLKVEDK